VLLPSARCAQFAAHTSGRCKKRLQPHRQLVTTLFCCAQVKGDTHLIVRRPEDCNLFTDPGCRLPLPRLEMTPRLLRDREANFGKLLSDIREQVGLRGGD
jgi:hypothetical protein